MRLRGTMMAAVIAVVVGVTACGNGPPDNGSGGGGGGAPGTAATSGLGTAVAKVDQLSSLHFQPTSSTIKVGQVIEWTNAGSVPHNVTFDSYASLTSSTMQQGDTWEAKFTVPGTYSYHCTFHPGMDGTITVTG